MRTELDDRKWADAWLDTPLTLPVGLSMDQTFKTPGCCVKSRDKRAQYQFGKLVRYDEAADAVVVRGHNSGISPRFVWTGTRAEYVREWEID